MKSHDFQRLLARRSNELWRDGTRAYYVLVSALMLQQARVARGVIEIDDVIAKQLGIETK